MTLEDVKNYLRLDTDDDDTLINNCILAVDSFVRHYTGLTDEEIEQVQDLQYAKYALIADMYELRQATVSGIQLNPFVEMVLNMYQRSLL